MKRKDLTELSKWLVIDFLLQWHRFAIKNISWKAKQKGQRLTVLLPWFSQFPLLKPCLILIFPSVTRGFWCPLFFIINGIYFLFLLHIFIVITIVIISIHFFLYLFIFFCLHAIIRIITIITFSIHFLRLFIPLLFFLIECQATCFKNSSYIFSKSGRYWYSN